MAALLTVEQALARVLDQIHPLPAETVPLGQAAGRVLADAARAVVDLPPFPSSAMDGFALRAGDAPGRLPVVARIAAGRPAARALRGGEAMAVATGAVVPAGADAVIPLEYVVDHDNEIEIAEAPLIGSNVRPRGGDIAVGETVVAAGTMLRPAQIGALAAAGLASVSCGTRPRLVILTTGTELRPPGERLGPGQIHESNGVMLAAALTAAGASVEQLPAVADDEEAHLESVNRGLEADVLVTSGGVSVGPHDLVRRVAARLGVKEVFWGVAVKPGKPVAFGVRGDTLVFGLPGNPVSSLVALELFVRPAVLALQGHSQPEPRFLPGRLAGELRRNASRDELVRARMEVGAEAVLLAPLAGQESHMIARAAGADALVFVPRGEGALTAGAPVRYLLLA